MPTTSAKTPQTMTIPIRCSPPPAKSLIMDPVFKILYEGNDLAINEFLIFKSPMSAKTFNNNLKFLEHVQDQEPGPRVDYDSIRANTIALRRTISTNQAGIEMMGFFSYLLRLRASWILAASNFYVFNLYTKMLQAVLNGPRDNQFIELLNMRAPAALKIWNKQIMHISVDECISTTNTQWQNLHDELEDISERLFNLKVSDKMWDQSSLLYEASEAHNEIMRKAEEEERKKRQARLEKRRALKNRNTRHVRSQMGMLGTQPFNQGVCSAIEGLAMNQHGSYFSFPEEQCVAPNTGSQLLYV